MHRPVFVIVAASLAGLLVGAAVPGAEQLRPLSLPGLFLQTLVAVGALAQAHVPGPRGWAMRTLVVHHVGGSLPLIGLGVALGLDTPLGAGTFLLGAVPPAAGLPSYAASTGAQVRPIVRFCLLGYVLGVFATPALVLAGFGAQTPTSATVLTLAGGLILPAVLGTLAHTWLRRIPSRISFAIVGFTVLVLTLSIGPSLRTALAAGVEDPTFLWGAAAVGFGRIVWAAVLGVVTAQEGMKLESALAVTYRNAVLAAVIAYAAVGPLAALPALLSLFGEAAFLVTVSVIVSRRRGHLITELLTEPAAPSGTAAHQPDERRGRSGST